MSATTRIAAWLGTLAVLAAIAIFTLIGLRNLVDPVGAAAETHTLFASPAGATSTRVGLGAFPLALAALLAFGLATRRRLAALATVATVMGLAAVARLIGLAIDGPAPESVRLLAPEVVLLVVSSASALIEWRAGRGRAPAAAPRSEVLHVSR